ncbi:DUF4760 domain-containing protein [Eubacterium sp.]
MIISFLLISILALILVFPCNIFTKEITWTIIGTIITSISVLVAVVTFVKNENIRKMQATYDAYNKFKETYFDFETEITKEYVEKALSDINNEEWNKITEYLSNFERIATCTNNGIFDANTIYLMSGPKVKDIFEILEPVIKKKREDNQRKTIYIEFEKLVNELEKM